MSRDCDRDDVEELLARIRAADDWGLDDWDFTVGRFESATVEITAGWDPELPNDLAGKVREAVSRLEDDHEHGAPVERVRDRINAPVDEIDTAIDHLHSKGELYKPNGGRLRTT